MTYIHTHHIHSTHTQTPHIYLHTTPTHPTHTTYAHTTYIYVHIYTHSLGEGDAMQDSGQALSPAKSFLGTGTREQESRAVGLAKKKRDGNKMKI